MTKRLHPPDTVITPPRAFVSGFVLIRFGQRVGRIEQ
jgi:hypothetical protein